MSMYIKHERHGNPQTEEGFIMIAEELAEALARINLSPREHRYLWALLLKTYRFQKKTDWVADTQIAAITGMARPHVNNAKHKLINRGIILFDGKKVGPNKHYREWGVPKQVHVPEPVQPSTGMGNIKIPVRVRKGTGTGTHKKRETKDSLTKEPTESEKSFRVTLLKELRMDDFAEPITEQWPILRNLFTLVEADGEAANRKWRGVKKLDNFRNIRRLETLFCLYKSSRS